VYIQYASVYHFDQNENKSIVLKYFQPRTVKRYCILNYQMKAHNFYGYLCVVLLQWDLCSLVVDLGVNKNYNRRIHGNLFIYCSVIKICILNSSHPSKYTIYTNIFLKYFLGILIKFMALQWHKKLKQAIINYTRWINQFQFLKISAKFLWKICLYIRWSLYLLVLFEILIKKSILHRYT